MGWGLLRVSVKLTWKFQKGWVVGQGGDQAKKRKKQHIVWRKSKIRKFDFTNLITINFIFFAGDFNVARHEGDCTDIVMRSSRAKQNINN